MVDAAVSKTAEDNLVRVRTPSPGTRNPLQSLGFSSRCPFRVHFGDREAPESAARIAHRSRPLGLRKRHRSGGRSGQVSSTATYAPWSSSLSEQTPRRQGRGYPLCGEGHGIGSASGQHDSSSFPSACRSEATHGFPSGPGNTNSLVCAVCLRACTHTCGMTRVRMLAAVFRLLITRLPSCSRVRLPVMCICLDPKSMSCQRSARSSPCRMPRVTAKTYRASSGSPSAATSNCCASVALSATALLGALSRLSTMLTALDTRWPYCLASFSAIAKVMCTFRAMPPDASCNL